MKRFDFAHYFHAMTIVIMWMLFVHALGYKVTDWIGWAIVLVGSILWALVQNKLHPKEMSDQEISNRMVAKLHTLPKDQWLGLDHQFNKWEFPMEFREFTPKWWEEEGNETRMLSIIRPLIKVIKDEFGRKEQLRFHNVVKGKMTNPEFEWWYENVILGNKRRSEEAQNKYYFRKAKMDQLEWWKDEAD